MQFRDLKRQYEHIKPMIDDGIADVIARTDFISGNMVKKLEDMLSAYVGVKHCISCGNGTDAITIALRALLESVPRSDWKDCAVFVPDFTFFSTGECPACLDLPTYFVDVKRDTYNIDPVSLTASIEQVLAEGRHKPSVVIAVDLFGQPAEYDTLHAICKKYGMFLLEDSAQGFGGHILAANGQKRMAGAFGDIATTSFFPAKPLGCYGDGGAIFTNDDNYAALCRSIAVHGKNSDDKYDNVRLGYNSRLDTIQAAVLAAKFPVFVNEELGQVNEVARWYNELLSDTSFALPLILDKYYSSWAQYTIQISEQINRDEVQWQMREHGIPTMVYYKKPMHEQRAFRDNTAGEHVTCPVAMQLCSTVLCLPIHPYLSRSEVEKICEVLKNNAM